MRSHRNLRGTSSPPAFFVTETAVGVTIQDETSGDDKTATAWPASTTAIGDGLLAVAQY